MSYPGAHPSSPRTHPIHHSPQWRRLRRWWGAQLPRPCARCGQPVEPWHEWHLDLVVPACQGGRYEHARPSHARCNTRAGGGVRTRRTAQPSRQW